MRVAYYIYVDWFGENQFFFDFHGNLLHWWSCNDANYRHEYMNPLMSKLGVQIVPMDKNERADFKLKIQDELRKHGATDEDFSDE
jgi:hypothetical protein